MTGFLQRVYEWLLRFDMANWLLETTVEVFILLLLLYPVRKWLQRRISPRHIVFVLLVYFTRIVYNLIEREFVFDSILATKIEPRLHVYFPIRIQSHIAGVESIGKVDWLILANLIWVVGFVVYGFLHPLKKQRIDKQKVKFDGLERENTRLAQHQLLDYWIGFWKDCEVDIGYLPGLKSPCTVSLTNPTILLDRLDYTDEELDMIFRHELSHIGGKHDLLIWEIGLIRRVFWFNPLLKRFQHWCENLMEFASDESAMIHGNATPKDRKNYARLLVDLAQNQGLHGAALYWSAGAEIIRERTKEILAPQSRKLSIPLLTMIVLLWIGIGSLITTTQADFLESADALALFGNNYDSLSRIQWDSDDMFRVVVSDVELVIREINGTTIDYMETFGECWSEAEFNAMHDKCGGFIGAFSDCFGIPETTGSDQWGWDWLMQNPKRAQERQWKWRVELSGDLKEKLGYDQYGPQYLYLQLQVTPFNAKKQYVVYSWDIYLRDQ